MKQLSKRAESEVIEIFAVLSKSQYANVQNGYVDVEIPSNTELNNKSGSRSLYFTCYGKKAAIELTDGLDASSVPWQEVYLGEDVLNGEPEEDEETEGRNSRHSS